MKRIVSCSPRLVCVCVTYFLHPKLLTFPSSCAVAAGGAVPTRALRQRAAGGPRRPQPGGHQREHGAAPGGQHPVLLHCHAAAGARGRHQRPEQGGGDSGLFLLHRLGLRVIVLLVGRLGEQDNLLLIRA